MRALFAWLDAATTEEDAVFWRLSGHGRILGRLTTEPPQEFVKRWAAIGIEPGVRRSQSGSQLLACADGRSVAAAVVRRFGKSGSGTAAHLRFSAARLSIFEYVAMLDDRGREGLLTEFLRVLGRWGDFRSRMPPGAAQSFTP